MHDLARLIEDNHLLVGTSWGAERHDVEGHALAPSLGSGACSHQRCPNGSTMPAKRAPQGSSRGAVSAVPPAATACANMASTSAGLSHCTLIPTGNWSPGFGG